MSSACANDFDCPDTQICYVGSSWLPDGVESLCDCSTYFGWVGADCTSTSYQTVVFLCIAYTGLALAALALGFNLFVIREVLRAPKVKWDTTTATLSFMTLALLAIAAWRVSTVIILLRPSKLVLGLLTSDEKLHNWTPVEKVSIAVATVFTLLSAINIVVKWIDVASMSAKMLNVPEGLWGSARRKIYAFMIAFVLALVGATVGGRMVYATLAALPFMCVIVAAYAYGLYVMNNLLGLLGVSLAQQSARGSFATGGQLADGAASADASGSASGSGGLSGALRKASVRLASVRLGGRKASAAGADADAGKAQRRLKRKQMRNNYFVVLQRVRRTAILVGLASVYVMVCLAVFSFPEITRGYKDVCRPGELCYIPLVADALSLGLLGMLGGLQIFIFDNVRGNQERERLNQSQHGGSKTSKDEPSVQPESFTGSASPVYDL